MATKTKDYTIPTTDQITAPDNGKPKFAPGEISAFEHLKEFFGMAKDDPYALEVWREIATSRHPERPYREPGKEE